MRELWPNITIEDDPEGLLEIDDCTLVICLYPSQHLLEVIADVVDQIPAAIIHNDLRKSLALASIPPEDTAFPENDYTTPRVVGFLKKYKDATKFYSPSKKEKDPLARLQFLREMKLFVRDNN